MSKVIQGFENFKAYVFNPFDSTISLHEGPVVTLQQENTQKKENIFRAKNDSSVIPDYPGSDEQAPTP